MDHAHVNNAPSL